MRHPSFFLRIGLVGLLALGAGIVGCSKKKKPDKSIIAPRYEPMGAKTNVPSFMKGTIWEQVEVVNKTPYPISNYGLVSRLRGTGENTVPSSVRNYMIREMTRRGFGNAQIVGMRDANPADALNSPYYAIVEVHAFLPPGVRKGEWIDAYVRCLQRNRTTSLSHGMLFETDLKQNGANALNPSATLEVYARVKGPIVVNPAYALNTPDPQAPTSVKASLRSGTVMYNAVVSQDRPIYVQLRQPQRSVSRAIELRVNEYFQSVLDWRKPNGEPAQSAAMDEGRVALYVPRTYNGDWKHFLGVATHLYFNNSIAFATAKAKELAEEAVKPDALLEDISYCWEGLGAVSLPHITPLFTHERPEVAFAAARAAAFIGDPSGAAIETLRRMAQSKGHPFQIQAIQALGGLRSTMAINRVLRELLDGDETTARIEAYRILVRTGDKAVYTRMISDPSIRRMDNQPEQKFALDIVPCNGPTIIYATRTGTPRIAIIGKMASLTNPVVFTAIDSRLSLASQNDGQFLTLFYRDEMFSREPVKTLSNFNIAEIIARLGGEGAPDEPRLNFTYGEILAILKGLTDQKKITVPAANGKPAQMASLVFQDPPAIEQELSEAPVIPETRPQGDGPEPGNVIEPAAPPTQQPAGPQPGESRQP